MLLVTAAMVVAALIVPWRQSCSNVRVSAYASKIQILSANKMFTFIRANRDCRSKPFLWEFQCPNEQFVDAFANEPGQQNDQQGTQIVVAHNLTI